MNPQDQTPQTIHHIGKIKASYLLVTESWNILKKNKELAWFPVLSMLVCMLTSIVLSTLFFFTVLQGDMGMLEVMSKEQHTLGYIGIFVYYLAIFFITNYFLAGLYTVVHGSFNGKHLSFTDGMQQARNNMGKIFLWSLISATVGVILRIIEDKSKFVGNILAGLFGAVWGILTYFSLPSLIIGQKNIKSSFTESAALIRKTWGEALIANFGMGIFFAIVFFVYSAFTIGLIILVPVLEVMIFATIMYGVFLLGFFIILSTLQAIFKLALYEYALTGKVPEGFTVGLIEGAVKGV